MPLTFAHPAAVLPFSRNSKYIHFTALVLGSMAPDFEYFLRGQPAGMTGHTYAGFFYFNLPLVALIYFIYHFFIHKTLFDHLPLFLQDRYERKSNLSIPAKVIVFCYSALLGMLTHVVWDAFTHQHGFMVGVIPILDFTFHLSGYDIPVYKFLQHGGTLAGLTLILVYMLFRARKYKQLVHREIPSLRKWIYWSGICLFALILFMFWNMADPVPIQSYGVHVVRIIDSSLISLLLVSILFNLMNKKTLLRI